MLADHVNLMMKLYTLIELVPSGKHTINYGKSPFSMGKSTIKGHFQ